MRMKFTALAGTAVALSLAGVVAAGSTQGASSVDPTRLVIRHATVGCHVWSGGGEALGVNRRLVIRAGQSFTVENRDNCAHRLVQLNGPAKAPMLDVASHAASDGVLMPLQPGVKITLDKVGTYVFTTTENDALAYGVETDNRFGFAKLASVGPDNTLTLVVQVTPDRNHPAD